MTPEELEDFKDDELINVKMPRGKYKRLMKMIEREEGYDWLTLTLSTSWIWVVGGGVLTIWLLYDKLQSVLNGVK